MTIKARIEAYTGAVSSSMTDRVKQSVAKVVELIPRDLLSPCVTLLSNIGSGVSTVGKKVVGVGNQAREVSETESYRYADPGSIYYVQSARDQIYWQSDHMVYSLPEDADCEVIDYSSVSETDSEIACLPPQFTEAVVLDVAIGLLSAQLAILTGTAFSLNIKTVITPGVVDLVYPPALSALTLAWSAIADVTVNFNADITTGLMTLRDALDGVKLAVEAQLDSGTEDIELGMARLNHAKALLDEYVQKSDVLFKKILANSEIEKLNVVKAFEKTLEDSHNALAKASHDLQLFTTHGQLLIAEHKENADRAASLTVTLQMLYQRFISLFQPFQAEKKQ